MTPKLRQIRTTRRKGTVKRSDVRRAVKQVMALRDAETIRRVEIPDSKPQAKAARK